MPVHVKGKGRERWEECRAKWTGSQKSLPCLIVMALPLVSLLAPVAKLTVRLPLAEQRWEASIPGLIRFFSGGSEAPGFLLRELSSPLFGTEFALFAATLALVGLTVLLGALVLPASLFSALGRRRLSAVAAIAGFAGAATSVCVFVIALFLRTAGSDFAEPSVSGYALLTATAFFCVGFFNICLWKQPVMPAADNGKRPARRPDSGKKSILKSRRRWLICTAAALLLVVLGGIAWGVGDLFRRGGVEQSPEAQAKTRARDAAIASEAPKTSFEMTEFLNAALEYAQVKKPGLRLHRAYRFGSDELDALRFTAPGTQNSIDAEQAARLRAALKIMAPALAKQLDSGYSDAQTRPGESFSALLWPLELRDSDLAEPPTCVYADGYTITMRFREASPGRLAFFRPPTPADLYGLLAEELEPYADIVDITPQLVRNAVFTAKIRRGETSKTSEVAAGNELISLQFRYDIDLRVTLRPKGEFAPIGDFTVTLTLGNNADFNFDWLGI